MCWEGKRVSLGSGGGGVVVLMEVVMLRGGEGQYH